jgi:hypothetical protein
LWASIRWCRSCSSRGWPPKAAMSRQRHRGPTGRSATAISSPGRTPCRAPRRSASALAHQAELADWRNGVLSLTSLPGASYIGWLTTDGKPKVGVPRRSVLSPLPMPPEAASRGATAAPVPCSGAGAHRRRPRSRSVRPGPSAIHEGGRRPDGFDVSGDHLRTWFYRTGDG